MRVAVIRERLASLGALPEHQARVLRDWVQGAPHERGRRRPADYLPKAVREALPQFDAELAGLAHVISEHPAADGSARLLVGLADGQATASACRARSAAPSVAGSA
jgi:23S rRNA (adenine2503-C2)-methyltransferase